MKRAFKRIEQLLTWLMIILVVCLVCAWERIFPPIGSDKPKAYE